MNNEYQQTNSEKNNHNNEDPMFKTKLVELLEISRYYYSLGIDKHTLSDREYDYYLNMLRNMDPQHELLHRTWSEDPIPYKTLKKYNMEVFKEEQPLQGFEVPQAMKQRYMDNKDSIENHFATTPSLSIEIVREEDELVKFLNTLPLPVKLHCSIKADGWNFEATYVDGLFTRCVTRGRTGEPKDITGIMQYCLPKKVEHGESYIIKMNGEITLHESKLPYLREKYNKPFKTARNSVSSFLNGLIEQEDLKLLKIVLFKVKHDNLTTLTEEFNWLKENGFEIVPFFIMEYDGTNYDLFKINFEQFSSMKNSLPYPSDGLVVGVDDNKLFYQLPSGSPKYYGGNRAVKIGVWDSGIYTGRLKGVIWSLGKYTITPIAIIEPTKMVTGAVATRVSLENINYMITHNVKPNSLIDFEYVGDSRINFIRCREDSEEESTTPITSTLSETEKSLATLREFMEIDKENPQEWDDEQIRSEIFNIPLGDIVEDVLNSHELENINEVIRKDLDTFSYGFEL